MLFFFIWLFKKLGIPHGFDAFAQNVSDIRSSGMFHNLFISYFNIERYHRIMSGIGALFFELGVIAFLPLYVIMKNFILFNIKIQAQCFAYFYIYL